MWQDIELKAIQKKMTDLADKVVELTKDATELCVRLHDYIEREKDE